MLMEVAKAKKIINQINADEYEDGVVGWTYLVGKIECGLTQIEVYDDEGHFVAYL